MFLFISGQEYVSNYYYIFQLHSEYRSTYRWYEYTPKQNQVVRRPPQPLAHNTGKKIFVHKKS